MQGNKYRITGKFIPIVLLLAVTLLGTYCNNNAAEQKQNDSGTDTTIETMSFRDVVAYFKDSSRTDTGARGLINLSAFKGANESEDAKMWKVIYKDKFGNFDFDHVTYMGENNQRDIGSLYTKNGLQSDIEKILDSNQMKQITSKGVAIPMISLNDSIASSFLATLGGTFYKLFNASISAKISRSQHVIVKLYGSTIDDLDPLQFKILLDTSNSVGIKAYKDFLPTRNGLIVKSALKFDSMSAVLTFNKSTIDSLKISIDSLGEAIANANLDLSYSLLKNSTLVFTATRRFYPLVVLGKPKWYHL